MNKTQPLTTYQRGALCYLSIRKKAKTNPAFSPLVDADVFIRSETWHSTKARWGLDRPGIREFLRGFHDASTIKAGPRDNLA